MRGVHPLFLGLHHGKDDWRLEEFRISNELKILEEELKPKEKDRKNKIIERSNATDSMKKSNTILIEETQSTLKKGEGKGNVPKNKKQA